MRQVIDGRGYDTASMRVLADRGEYSDGNYCGSDSLRVTRTGVLCFVVTSNGQDMYRRSYIEPVSVETARERIDGWKLNEDEIAALTAAGVIKGG